MPRTEMPDQQRVATAVQNGAIGSVPLSVAKAVNPSGSMYVFAYDVIVTYRQNTLSFRDGIPYSLHLDLYNYLVANGITPTAA